MTQTYDLRRTELTDYFDRVAADAWARLTSDAPVSRIRATVRAGRDNMRAALLSWLPADLSGRRILDAGCGTGAFAVEAARRGASVTAIDVSPTLIELARKRLPTQIGAGTIQFVVGDMLAPDLGRFDHVVAMDSLIHYTAPDVVRAIAHLATRTDRSILFTFAPRTPLLTVMHAAGRLFPRANRAPAIEPVAERNIIARLERAPGLETWQPQRSHRVTSGFYMSHGLELART